MNFVQQVKNELLSLPIEDKSCKQSFLSGAIRAIGTLNISKKSFNIILNTTNAEYILYLVDVIKSLYMVHVTASSKNINGLNKGKIFNLEIPTGQSKQILEDCNIMEEKNGSLVAFKEGICKNIFKDDNAAKNFVKSLFIGCGNVFIPSKIDLQDEETNEKSDGYRVEFVLNSKTLADDLVTILKVLTKQPKVIERQNNFVVYIKDSESVSDLLAWMGANDSVLTLNDIIVERIVANDVNRMNNCTMANLDKTVNAGIKQVKAIEYIQQIKGLDSLTPALKEVALLRLSKPSATLTELEELMNGKVTKSGLNHRLRKIVDIAEKLKNERGMEE